MRLYHHKKQECYEEFCLKDLKNDNEKLRKFLFLLHKDRLISKNTTSPVDRLLENSKLYVENYPSDNGEKHITEQLYKNLKKFDGLGFINPDTIANMSIFGNNEYQGYFESNTLNSYNEDVFNFFQQLTIKDNEITISNKDYENTLKTELGEDYIDKIYFIIKKLNKSLIHFIDCSDKGVTQKNINIFLKNHTETCDCLMCNYENFDFAKLIHKLKNIQGTEKMYELENAYAFHKIRMNDNRWAYLAYKGIRERSKIKKQDIEYFIATYNFKKLERFVRDGDFEEGQDFEKEADTIDLHQVIYETLEVTTDIDIKVVLKELAETTFFNSVDYEVDKIVRELRRTYELYLNGGTSWGGSNLNELYKQLIRLYKYTRANFVIFDGFEEYKKIAQNIFEGFLISSSTDDAYKGKLLSFNNFMLKNAVMHIDNGSLRNLLKRYKIENLKVDTESYDSLLQITKNLIGSVTKSTKYGDYENDEFICELKRRGDGFIAIFGNILNNLFTLLCYIDIKQIDFVNQSKSLVLFLEYEGGISHQYFKGLCDFFIQKGNLLTSGQLLECLTMTLQKGNPNHNTYDELVIAIGKGIRKYHKDFQIKENTFLHLLFAKFQDRDNLEHTKLIDFYFILGTENQEVLRGKFIEYLDNEFNYSFYRTLLIYEILDHNFGNYFEKLVITEQNSLISWLVWKQSPSKYDFWNSEYDHYFLIFSQLIYTHNLFDDSRIAKFQDIPDLPNFEKWLLNPYIFDYESFDVEWLFRVFNNHFERLKTIDSIKQKLVSYLKGNPKNTKFSQILNCYFLE